MWYSRRTMFGRMAVIDCLCSVRPPPTPHPRLSAFLLVQLSAAMKEADSLSAEVEELKAKVGELETQVADGEAATKKAEAAAEEAKAKADAMAQAAGEFTLRGRRSGGVSPCLVCVCSVVVAASCLLTNTVCSRSAEGCVTVPRRRSWVD